MNEILCIDGPSGAAKALSVGLLPKSLAIAIWIAAHFIEYWLLRQTRAAIVKMISMS